MMVITAAKSPYADPLGYPGRTPTGSGLLVGREYVHAAERREIDAVLASLEAPLLDERTPVVAVGSNASPDQLRAKLRSTTTGVLAVPMTLTRTHGIAAGVSAHVSRSGYVPATPIRTPGETSDLFAVWLDDDQLVRMDETEPNYDRVPIPEHPAEIYTSKHGCLLDENGEHRRLRPQPELIAELVAESQALRAIAGATPEMWLERMRPPEIRDQARRIWIDEGRTGDVRLDT